MVRLIHGFGVNDSNYVTYPTIDGVRKKCKAYESWVNMISRAYSKSYHDKFPTYIGVSVCQEWKSFMKFREWWLANYVDGWELDKDILSSGRIYSPETCIYVPRWLNGFLCGSDASRGESPIGVRYEKSRGLFRAECSNPINGCTEFIGRFRSKDEAHAAWVSRKISIASGLKNKMDSIDTRVYELVIKKIKGMI